MGTEGFEPSSAALEAAILARLYYVPAHIQGGRSLFKAY
jgi:hypothetical protein